MRRRGQACRDLGFRTQSEVFGRCPGPHLQKPDAALWYRIDCGGIQGAPSYGAAEMPATTNTKPCLLAVPFLTSLSGSVAPQFIWHVECEGYLELPDTVYVLIL